VTPRVAIVVLNWNGLADTLACLESLAGVDYPSYDIVVVDNGSTDGSVAVIREQFPDVVLIENDENLGFAGGNNVGLQWVLERGSDYALLLNNDTEVALNFLHLLVETAEADSTIGIAGPTIYYHEQPQIVWSAGGGIDWRRGQTWMMGLNEHDVGQFGEEPRKVDFVTGCCMLVRRAVLEQVGLLDERFFAYYEETEWCVRAQRAGFKIVHVPQAKIWHKIPLDARESSPVVHYYMTRNRLLFLKTIGAGWRAWLHTLLFEYLRTLLSWTLRPRWRGRGLHRRMMLRAIGDTLRGRWGCLTVDRVT
jgi:GT2 family glycosyltransferase